MLSAKKRFLFLIGRGRHHVSKLPSLGCARRIGLQAALGESGCVGVQQRVILRPWFRWLCGTPALRILARRVTVGARARRPVSGREESWRPSGATVWANTSILLIRKAEATEVLRL